MRLKSAGLIDAQAHGLVGVVLRAIFAAQHDFLTDICADSWWEDVTLPMLESVRRRLRGLVGNITAKPRSPIYTDFEDELGELSIKELTALAQKDPNHLNFGSAGVGSSVHMIGELYKMVAKAPITHVPYKGSSAAINDLMGGQIQLMFENPPTVIQHVKGGKLKALAVSGKQRLPALPDVPTGIESGYPGFEATSWTTIAVGAKVPDAIADKLNADIRKVVATPAFQKGLQDQGMTPVASPRDVAASLITGEKQRWDKVIAEGKLNAD